MSEEYNDLMQLIPDVHDTSTESEYSATFQEHHGAHSELVVWLQTHKNSNGIIGKRSAIEREMTTTSTQERRKVKLKN
jgi:hypothetical protein